MAADMLPRQLEVLAVGLSFREIQRIVESLETLTGALLQEVYQPTQTELVLELRFQRESRLLLLSAHARFSRLHLVQSRPPNPLKPFPFQMLCRKELSGRLDRLEQTPGDRIVRLTFQGAQRRTLLAELTDRRANLFLLDENDHILGSLLPMRGDARGLLPGQPYLPLPPPPTSPRIVDRFAELPPDADLHTATASFFADEQRRAELEELRGQLRGALRREMKRLDRRRADLEGDLQRAEKAEQHRRFGDLLQIHLKSIPRGKSLVTVSDTFAHDEDALVDIPLDPQLDAVGNIQRHYRLYRKYDASIPMVLDRIEMTEAELKRLAGLEQELESATAIDQVRLLEKSAGLPLHVPSRAPSAAKRAEERKPYLRYQTPHGTEIWVGRSAQDNDALTFQVARGNDFWLHVRGTPGAHVVIPARGTTPDLDTLIDAAVLALKHSGFQTGARAEVAYTRVKYVRRTGVAPGLVTFSQDKTLFVELIPDRLGRLTRLE